MWIALGELCVVSSHSFSSWQGRRKILPKHHEFLREFFCRGTVLWGLSTALKRSVLLQVRYACSNPGIKSLLLFPVGSRPGILYVCNFMVGVQHERSIAVCDILLLWVMPSSFLHSYLNSFCAESLPSLPSPIPCVITSLSFMTVLNACAESYAFKETL